jgi:hypothetical protein
LKLRKDIWAIFENKSNLDTTSILSLSSFLLSLSLSLAYYTYDKETKVSGEIFMYSWPLLIPFFLNQSKYKSAAKVLISWITPSLILLVSFESKYRTFLENNVNPINYFDVRVILLITLIIPFAIIEINKTRLLLVSLIPSFISIALFDPIHNALGIGYYDVGLSSPDYYLSANLFTLVTYLFICIALISFKKENYNKSRIEKESNQKLRLYLDTLLQLNKSSNIQMGDLPKVFNEILTIIQNTLTVSRASIWFYNAKLESIESKALIEKGELNYNMSTINIMDCPAYFEEIKTQKILVSNDVQKTSCLTGLKDYMDQLDIKSMMDVPFYKDGEFGGVICLEQQISFREWSIEDRLLCINNP